jgi:hypothetical protein
MQFLRSNETMFGWMTPLIDKIMFLYKSGPMFEGLYRIT